MNIEDWIKHNEKNGVDTVQVRMISSGNELIGRDAFSSPKYGLYLTSKEERDPIVETREAGTRSAIGGGATMTAPMMFFINPALIGYKVKVRYDSDYNTDEIVGSCFGLRKADEVAYKSALETAREIIKRTGMKIQDKTSEDLSQFAKSPQLELEKRVYDWKNRSIASSEFRL
ncbi:MAG: hypothetical protein WCV90_07120 [Candidatus Woesearchaeota archaeon]